ncbi:hypothetical protein DEJ39_08520 [Bacteroidetes bacterium SCGC AAA795-G10]|nr:hypothetical protein DEJ39_08520 [Bacteroidetes bacterium SCGC AAA795-G10]
MKEKNISVTFILEIEKNIDLINYPLRAVHTPDTYGDNTIVKQINVTDVTENFHTYGLEWTKENLKFFVDGNHYFTYEPKNKTPKNWPYVNDQFIILNIAMGGSLGGSIDPNFSEDQMEVDFVRVYQQK